MQMSYPVTEYRICIERAFCELLLQIQYASQLPNTERLTKFLTRIKEGDPTLELPEFCRTGLPNNWIYMQYNRGPLTIVPEDEFRKDKIRFVKQSQGVFDETRWGFGTVELNWWLVGNNGSAIEAAEALYYMRIYKLKSVDYCYMDTNWHSRLIHEPLNTFEVVDLESLGTAFAIQWTVLMHVPVLCADIEGTIVAETCTNFLSPACVEVQLPISGYRTPMDLDKSEPLGTVSSTGDGLIIEEGFEQ